MYDLVAGAAHEQIASIDCGDKAMMVTVMRDDGVRRLAAEMVALREAFDRVFQPTIESRMFGSERRRHQGFSDFHDGVQWNAGVDRERGVITVGVNLEGIQYFGWPIARFIEAEQQSPQLPGLALRYEHADEAELWFSRDAWQAASRFDILEQHFGPPPPVLLRDLSEALWKVILRDAYECLDSSRGYRGRGRQFVTLGRTRREMAVSPHIQIKLIVRRSTDTAGLVEPFTIARQKLQPLRELLQRQTRF